MHLPCLLSISYVVGNDDRHEKRTGRSRTRHLFVPKHRRRAERTHTSRQSRTGRSSMRLRLVGLSTMDNAVHCIIVRDRFAIICELEMPVCRGSLDRASIRSRPRCSSAACGRASSSGRGGGRPRCRCGGSSSGRSRILTWRGNPCTVRCLGFDL